MKIVIAPDSFKENLTSLQVATAIEKGIKRVLPNAHCVKIPMADGGEGTVQSLVDATGGRIIRKQVTGPMGEPVNARFGLLGDGKTAVIEMAEASGLPLVEKAKRDPSKATTYGTGELIRNALHKGVEAIIVGIGGSATVDGGAGMAQALGVRFMDKSGNPLADWASGGVLNQIWAIDTSGLDPRVRRSKIVIACDVNNPLYGPRGAARVFGPQKGASPAMVKLLDDNLKHFGTLLQKTFEKDIAKLPGAGAAGGLGAGLVAFAGAKMKRGIELVVKITGLERELKDADLVITGEGRVDFQTAFGKTPAGIAEAARRSKVPVIAIGGGLADDARGVFEHGIDALASAAARDMDLAEAMRLSRVHLENAAERVMRLLLVGKKLGRKQAKKKPREK
ncbi:MAG: glycerate kinase [Gammaproteobacteria bacterium]